jgi:7tm Chemosensory receptor
VNKKASNNLDELLKLLFFVFFGVYMSSRSANINLGDLNSMILELGIKFLMKLTFFMPTFFRIFNFIVREKHEKIVKDIHKVDLMLRKIGVKIDHEKHLRAALAVTGFYFLSLFFTLTFDQILSTNFLQQIEMDVFEGIFAAINIAAYLSYQISHMLIIVAIFTRVKHVNEILSRKIDVKTLKTLGKIQLKLFDTANLINFCFSFDLLNFFLQFLFFLIFFLFDIFHFVTTDSTLNDWIFVSISFGYLQFYFWFGAWVILHAGQLSNEVSEMESLVQSKVTSEEDQKRFIFLTMQLQHSKIYVSSGIFVIDWNFLFIMIGSVFSYIIILIQFDFDA